MNPSVALKYRGSLEKGYITQQAMNMDSKVRQLCTALITTFRKQTRSANLSQGDISERAGS